MPQLPWQAEDVLAVLARFDLRPGRGVPVQSLWQSIGKGKDVSEGVLQLVALKYVELNKAQTEVILTDLGYRIMRGEERGGELGSTAQTDTTLTASVPDSRRAVILTALEVETRAVLRHLHDVQEETVKQTVFHVLSNPVAAPQLQFYMPSIKATASSVGVEVKAAPVHTKEEIEGVIAAQAQPGGGLIVMPDAFTTANSELIIALAARYRVPTIFNDPRNAD